MRSPPQTDDFTLQVHISTPLAVIDRMADELKAFAKRHPLLDDTNTDVVLHNIVKQTWIELCFFIGHRVNFQTSAQWGTRNDILRMIKTFCDENNVTYYESVLPVRLIGGDSAGGFPRSTSQPQSPMRL